jgi:uncharacterized membrane protein YgdD (TMEM256/DUF423 family)
MDFLPRLWCGLGALLVAVGIGLAAWHAHGLVAQLDPDAYSAFGRALQQQYIAGLGLLAAGILLRGEGSRLGHMAAAGILIGAVLFCGDVYLSALRGHGFGVAPFGGSVTILSWVLLAGEILFSGNRLKGFA